MVNYQIIIEPSALKMLAKISDRRVQEKIKDRISGLVQEPEKQGRPLTGDLTGFRSLRAIGQRFRIIYQVKKSAVLVVVIALGFRKEGSKADIYTLAKKLLRLGLLDHS